VEEALDDDERRAAEEEDDADRDADDGAELADHRATSVRAGERSATTSTPVVRLTSARTLRTAAGYEAT